MSVQSAESRGGHSSTPKSIIGDLEGNSTGVSLSYGHGNATIKVVF